MSADNGVYIYTHTENCVSVKHLVSFYPEDYSEKEIERMFWYEADYTASSLEEAIDTAREMMLKLSVCEHGVLIVKN